MRTALVLLMCSLTLLTPTLSELHRPQHSAKCSKDSINKLLVVVPCVLMGLTNQIMTMITGILLGSHTGRDICLGGFYARTGRDLVKRASGVPPLVPASGILNMAHLNEIFAEKLKGSTLCACNPQHLTNVTCTVSTGRVSFLSGFCGHQKARLAKIKGYAEVKLSNITAIATPEKFSDIQNLVIGNPWILFNEDYRVGRYNLGYLGRIKFSSFFERIVDNAMNKLFAGASADGVVAVHLRVENDFLKTNTGRIHISDRNKMYYLLDCYVEFIRKQIPDSNTTVLLLHGLKPSDDLYLATAYIRLFYPNTYTLDAIEMSQQLHNPMLKQSNSNEKGMYQIGAIFDLIAAQKAKSFIGVKTSTFSLWLEAHFRFEKKPKVLYLIPDPPIDEELKKFKNTSTYELMRTLSSKL